MLGRVHSESSVGQVVGRESELGHLEQTLDALDQGSAACLTDRGGAGHRQDPAAGGAARPRGGRGNLVLAGAASEFERDLPFSVWVDALDAYVASQALDRARRARPQTWRSNWRRSCRRYVTARGDAAAIADERYRSHRAIRRLLRLIADDHPLLLVLDDLHWSDEASIELIAALLRPPARCADPARARLSPEPGPQPPLRGARGAAR